MEQINEISPVLYNNSYYSDIKASLFPFVAYRNGFGLARIFAVIFFVLLAGLLPIGFFVQIQESVWQKKYDKALESYENGNLEDAGQYAKEALDTAKNSITLRDSDEPLYSMLLSADIYYDQNKLAEAEPIFRELLAKYEKKDSQFHTFIGKYSFLTAESCFAQGKLDEAEIFYNKALTAQNYSYWADKLMLAKLLRSLGVIYCRKGNLLKSEELLNKALNIYETNSGTDEDTVEVLKNLAETYKKMGKPDQSEMMLERAEGILSED
ncbi:MAG: tetratricopeptide repeat protein [Planctomycetes bacterium]|nr:tetratricopeptide repeat protein [Planctomycetota bacterium]